MISKKWINEINNSGLSIDEHIRLIESLRVKINEEIQIEIDKIKDNAIYCPFCNKYYEKVNYDVYDKSVEHKENYSKYEEYEEKGFKVKYFVCPVGHKLRRVRKINENKQTDGFRSDVWFE